MVLVSGTLGCVSPENDSSSNGPAQNNFDITFQTIFPEPICATEQTCPDVSGATFVDYDRDGLTEIIIEGVFYRRAPAGWVKNIIRIDDQEAEALPAGPYLFADYDNDGQLDVYAGGSHALLHGEGWHTGHDHDSPIRFRFVKYLDPDVPYGAAAWGDYDNDGLLDLFVAGGERTEGTYIFPYRDFLYQNLGDGEFRDVTDEAGMSSTDLRVGSVATWADYDDDGDLDLYVGQYRVVGLSLDTPCNQVDGTSETCGDNQLWINQKTETGEARFVDLAYREVTGVTYDVRERGQRTTSATWVDYDNDGDLDLYTTTLMHEVNLVNLERTGSNDSSLFENVGQGKLLEVTDIQGLNAHQNDQLDHHDITPVFFDADSDGDLDLYITFSTQGRESGAGNFYRRDGNRFTLVALSDNSPLHVDDTWGASALDWNADGDIDLFLGSRYWGEFGDTLPGGNGGTITFLENVMPHDTASRDGLHISLWQDRANHDAIGAFINVFSSDGKIQTRIISQFSEGEGASVSAYAQYIGARSWEAKSAIVRWPDNTLECFSLSDAETIDKTTLSLRRRTASLSPIVCYDPHPQCPRIDVEFPIASMGMLPHRASIEVYDAERNTHMGPLSRFEPSHASGCSLYDGEDPNLHRSFFRFHGNQQAWQGSGLPSSGFRIRFEYQGRAYSEWSEILRLSALPACQGPRGNILNVFLPLIQR